MSKTAAISTRDFLPTTRAEMHERGWKQCDFVYVSGDAYVDHPSFGTAIIARLLEAHGYKVGIIAQPDWRDPASVTRLGEPRLGFLVSAPLLFGFSFIITPPLSFIFRTRSRQHPAVPGRKHCPLLRPAG